MPRFLLVRHQRPLNTLHCIYMSLQKLGNEQLTHYDCEIVHSVHYSQLTFRPAAQRISQVKWLTPVKSGKNACPASALFQCSLIRSDAAGHKTTQRRRRPPAVRRRTALISVLISLAMLI